MFCKQRQQKQCQSPSLKKEGVGNEGNITCTEVGDWSSFPPVLSCSDLTESSISCSDFPVEMFHGPDNLEMNSQVYQRHLWFGQLDYTAQPMLHFGRVVAELC